MKTTKKTPKFVKIQDQFGLLDWDGCEVETFDKEAEAIEAAGDYARDNGYDKAYVAKMTPFAIVELAAYKVTKV